MKAAIAHRELGWRPEGLKPHHVRFSHLFGARPVPTIFAKPDVRDFRGSRYLQRMLSSCVAHAIKRAIRVCDGIAARELGAVALPDAAARFMYWTGRRQAFAGQDPASIPPPEDAGMFPGVAMDAVKLQGFCREEECPYDLSVLGADGKPPWTNAMPAPEAFRAAIDQRGLDYYAIDGRGDDRIQGVRDALRSGFAVIHGIQVDHAMVDFHGENRIESIDPGALVGGHMLATLAVEDDGTIVTDNWWEDWGDTEGMGRIAPSVFGDELVSDVFAVRTVPTFSAREAA